MALAVYTYEIPESKRVGGMINACATAGIITNALVAANATVTLLKAAILAAVPFAMQYPMAQELNKALAKSVTLGFIPETTGVTTVADLVALTNASSTLRQGFYS